MEKLSHLILNSVKRKKWRGLKPSRNGPTISHLFYADDLILFSKAEARDCNVVMDILNSFCETSGQKVNILKSKVFVSKNVTRDRIGMIRDTTGIPITKNLGMYLGIPLIHEKVKKDSFKHIVDRVAGKLSTWKMNLMSLAGRLTLINSVTSSIPTYSMQMCHLPMSVCDKLDRINRIFLWGNGQDDRKTYLVNWDGVCKAKKMGGLGIRKSIDNNLANLAKVS